MLFVESGWIWPVSVLVAAALVDSVLGDPWSWPHPVQAMGWLIQRGSRLGQRVRSPHFQKIFGIALALTTIAASGTAAAFVFWLAGRFGGPWLRWPLEVVLLASCFAGRSLRNAAEDVLAPLRRDDLVEARQRLARYVGRDTDTLQASEILRAVLETVSENATDGVLAPLFYAGIGAVTGIGSVPVAMAYKAASTLDSMVGYRRAPYKHLGWFSARLEDGLTWLPCRAVVLTVALLSGQPRRVLRICDRDARADPSPNAGWSECAYAAALGVRLGGWNQYQGEPTFKPYLGDDDRLMTPKTVRQALQLTRYSFGLWLAGWVAAVVLIELA